MIMRIFRQLAVGICLACMMPPVLAGMQLHNIRATAMTCTTNLLSNASFEAVDTGGTPTGWTWDKRNTDATCVCDTKYAHSGKYALKVTNNTPISPNIYGMLVANKPIAVHPGKHYTLSAWVRTDDPGGIGTLWLGGGWDWQFRMHFQAVNSQWQLVQMPVIPDAKDTELYIRMVTESPTATVWIDDIKLEEGDEINPVYTNVPGAVPALSPLTPSLILQGDGGFALSCLLALPKAIDGTLEAVIPGISTTNLPIKLDRGYWRLNIMGSANGMDDTSRALTLRVVDGGKEIARAALPFQLLSETYALQRLDTLQAQLPTWKAALDTLQAQGQDISYPLITYTVLQNFIGYARDDSKYQLIAGWNWKLNNNPDAAVRITDASVHSGRHAICLVNNTPIAPHTFGVLTSAKPVMLQADKPYVLSAWVKTSKDCAAWIGGGSNWQFRCHIPTTGGVWKQISLPFTPGAADMKFTVMLLTEGPTDGIYLDDVTLTDSMQANLLPEGDFEQCHRELVRAFMQIHDLEQMATRLTNELQAATQKKIRFPVVPKWTGTERPTVQRSSFIAPTKTVGQQTSEKRPVFFTGYGHFNQVRADIEKFPAYGTNIVQVEFGPVSIFQRDETPINDEIQRTVDLLNRAQKAGVAVNLLISPHYFPKWMLTKYPELNKKRGGFMQFCLHSPQGQAFLDQYIKTFLPVIKDHPALHSIVLTNEPVNVEEPCAYALTAWHAWLQKRHGSIAVLNRRWGADYANFDAVPLYNPIDKTIAGTWHGGPWLDYVRFNQEFFAGWHQHLADTVHAIAPNLPVTSKPMSFTMVRDDSLYYGVDATLFGKFSQINGNDSFNYYTGTGEFAQSWQLNPMEFDLQRSVKDAPVFNSENHLILDGDTRFVPAVHVRSVLWQSAIHGQSGTTIWVWERTFGEDNGFVGSIMHRPSCAEAVGVVNDDLNRAAQEVTALQQAPAQVMILDTVSSAAWNADNRYKSMEKLYTALDFTGLQLGFITERQLEAGILPSAPVVIIPEGETYLSDTAYATLQRYTGRIIRLSPAAIARNEYNQSRTLTIKTETWQNTKVLADWKSLWQALLPKLPVWKLAPAVQVRAADGQPLWGVEWRCAKTQTGQVINLSNFRKVPVTVKLFANGKMVTAVDVLTGKSVIGTLTLQPMEVRLLRIAR
ncbi:MAG TPA: beta-galactosidase [Armatimonadota bacterium]|nr:beta-galactosidase [Armatimonadota bacterium]